MNANVRNIIVNYFRNQPVEKAWIFGSYSRGEEREDSDVDILVTFKKDERIGLKYAAMVCDLEDLLQKRWTWWLKARCCLSLGKVPNMIRF